MHIKNIRTYIIFAVFSGLSVQLQANENVADSPQHNFPVAEQQSSSKLMKKRNDYLSERGWQLGSNARDDGSSFYISWGQADIAAGQQDLAFPDARVAAFEQALLDAKGQFVTSRAEQVASESISEIYTDDRPVDPNSLSDERSVMAVITEKLLAVGEAKLDEFLRENGIDPAGLSKQEKRIQAKNEFQKTVTRKAMDSVVGFRPLTTFEDGGSVGVVAVYSPKQEALARSIRNQSVVAQPSLAGPGTVQEILDGSLTKDSDYIFQHGVRLLYDNKGNPWLVGFAQAGVKATKQASRLKLNMLIKGSRQAAADLARAQMAEFLQGTVSYDSSTTLLSSAEIAEISQADKTQVNTTTNVGKLVQTKIRQNAKVSMEGLTTLKNWSANHPDTGHLIVGEVVAWSPMTLASVRSSAAEINTTAQQGSQGNKKGAAVPVRSGADFESNASF